MEPIDIFNEELLINKEEIRERIDNLRKELNKLNIDYAVIIQNADIFYFTGIVQQGIVIISQEQEPVFLVKKNIEIARKFSRFPLILPISSFKDISKFINPNSIIGFETDVLPYKNVLYYSNIIKAKKIVDISTAIRNVRAVKSAKEITFIEKASTQLARLIETLPEFITPGITEREVFTQAVSILMSQSHQGYCRMRGFNQEMFYGHILSGKKGLIESYLDAPTNGSGIYPAFPQGSNGNILEKGTLLSVDLVGCFNGYHSDQTRAFALGKIKKEIEDNFKRVLEIEHETVNIIKPGVLWEKAYEKAIETARNLKVADFFMGSEHKVKFVGHGIGVEVDEFPFIAQGFKNEFKENMVFAIEPKLFLKDIGIVGIENTFRIGKNSCEKLTKVENKIFLVSPHNFY